MQLSNSKIVFKMTALTYILMILFHPQGLSVFSPPENLIGTITICCNWVIPYYEIFDALTPESPLFKVDGPICNFSCLCGDADFPIYRYGVDRKIGLISKKWNCIINGLFAESPTVGVAFPSKLENKYKVLFLAACFFVVSKSLHFLQSYHPPADECIPS